MSTANSHNSMQLIRGICMSLALVLAAAGGPPVFRGVRIAFQNAEDVTSQFMDRLDQELTWRLHPAGV